MYTIHTQILMNQLTSMLMYSIPPPWMLPGVLLLTLTESSSFTFSLSSWILLTLHIYQGIPLWTSPSRTRMLGATFCLVFMSLPLTPWDWLQLPNRVWGIAQTQFNGKLPQLVSEVPDWEIWVMSIVSYSMSHENEWFIKYSTLW